MATIEFESPRETEDERILRWRLDELVRAGYPTAAAELVAPRHDIDLHAAASLVRRGCPVETALRILL